MHMDDYIKVSKQTSKIQNKFIRALGTLHYKVGTFTF